MLHVSAKDDKALDDHAFGRADDQGGVVRLSLWNHLGNGIYGSRRASVILSACRRCTVSAVA
jgi:hypothetical protein